MSTYPALFIGGPWDGEVRELARPEPYIYAAVVDDVIASYTANDFGAERFVSSRKTVYRRERLALFGRPVAVWVHETVGSNATFDEAARHLLSPLARTLVRAYS